jgi:hypothetical protein
MAGLTFIQNSRLGRSIFQLRGEQLEVSWFGGARAKKTFPLLGISPDYYRGRRRFHLLYIVPGVFGFFGLGAVWIERVQNIVEHQFIFLYPWILALAGIVGIIRGVPRVEFFQFYDHWRRPLFYLVRERSQADECDDFVRVVLDAIERVQAGDPLPATIPPPAVSSVRLPDAHEAYFVGEIRWQMSIALGNLSVLLALLPQTNTDLGGLLFFIVFGASVGGMLFAWLSYQRKERYRHFALVGAILSLTAPLFY